MKKRFIIIIGLLLLAGCKDYLDVNTNPNQAVVPPIDGLLASTTFNTGMNTYRIGNITSYFVQYLASPNASSGGDTYDQVDYTGTWYQLYNNMTDLYDLMKQAREVGSSQHLGAGMIMMAMNLQLATDMWGSIPYSGAFIATSKDPATLTPAYDGGEAIYTACIKLLDDAIVELNKTDSKFSLDTRRDLIHFGNVAAWKRTAYLLKARFLNHYSKKPAYSAANVLAALANSYTENGHDAQLTQFQARSPWNQAAYNNTTNLLDGWMSAHFINALNGADFGLVDPRIRLITDTTRFGDYRGTINGKGRVGTGTNKEESYLSVNNGFFSKGGAPLMLASFAEAKFIEAEAQFRAGQKTPAYNAYLAGINANMDKMGVPAPAKLLYMQSPVVAVGDANITLALIMKEKHVAMFLQPEAFADARRFDFQYKNFNLPQNALLTTFIRRVAYPVSEKSRNAANVPPVAKLDEKLWWDQ